ncbi:MAG: zf-HC2 domain-containing protein [Gammaproteobacteria bacterium]|jgi:hypothetical protein
MRCETTTQYLNDFLDGGLDQPQLQEIQSHIDECEACHGLVQREQGLRAALRGLPAPELRPDFLRSALAVASQRHERRARRRAALGGAIAAGFALFVVANLLVMTPVNKPGPVPQITLAQGQLREIKLVFDSKTNVDGATFIVKLPGHVALKGFPHRHSISWKGQLKQGKNLLVLPVMATGPVEGDLVTWIEHAENKKAFHLAIQMKGGNLSRSSYRLIDMT